MFKIIFKFLNTFLVNDISLKKFKFKTFKIREPELGNQNFKINPRSGKNLLQINQYESSKTFFNIKAS
jgi:hypothetical protein